MDPLFFCLMALFYISNSFWIFKMFHVQSKAKDIIMILLPDVHDAASCLVTQQLGQSSLLTGVKISEQGLAMAHHEEAVPHWQPPEQGWQQAISRGILISNISPIIEVDPALFILLWMMFFVLFTEINFCSAFETVTSLIDAILSTSLFSFTWLFR